MALRTADFDYELPPGLIAQQPLPQRTASRMMVVDRARGTLAHHHITDIATFLRPGDVLVMNNTRVFPARLRGRREDTGGNVEVLLLAPPQRMSTSDIRHPPVLPALLRSGFAPRPGIRMILADGNITGEIMTVGAQGRVEVRLAAEGALVDQLEAHGEIPLPPYIRRAEGEGRDPDDRERYQTVYARHAGAVAAPTAGLHFTPALLDTLREQGVGQAEVTLHVGLGTFRPVSVERVEDHAMHGEWYCVDDEAAAAIRAARQAQGRIVAVGTTTVRTLETTGGAAGAGESTLFIYPPRAFACVDVMLTNFHLPRSTLLMMVSAFAGMDLVREAYAEAIREQYRFYSYGDCMLIV